MAVDISTSKIQQQIMSMAGGSQRKVAPAVPPKPAKKPQPQVPRSESIKKPAEPSYSTVLHGQSQGQGSTRLYSNLPQQMDESSFGGSTATYCNLPYNSGGDMDDLPPPPLMSNLSRMNTACLPPPPDDLLPPAPSSPVSSSYSELRRAQPTTQQVTQVQLPVAQQGALQQNPYYPQYNPYAPGSQTSSTYESIYEPINPRPASQLSTNSNYSLYAPYVSKTQTKQQVTDSGKEAEVDALTDLLLQSMDSANPDSDFYGICSQCNEKVIGEGSGCTAMDKIYHIRCFTCHHCQIPLQGKPFYGLEGKPYCEEDYLNTLEKCSVCMKPILDRILRATGKPYHPGCFCCVVCGQSLDGIPFTVDATNQIHCIEDFHKKFAPRCCVCRLPIMPEPDAEETVRVVALDRSFHINCYKCEDCGLLLSSEAEGRGCYPLDDHVLCKGCNASRVQRLTSHIATEL
ncbi:lipoma-preferred partner homolog [Neocloeon triangulifer]|uniref:lipoma-preferred partner homolog n=1 Tax=Neocloeon triangulifer TaxID=2078957 RepID=UPI00286ED46B|nr:lipoma-preferred partner homolog [Neocloeon triangulifer]